MIETPISLKPNKDKEIKQNVDLTKTQNRGNTLLKGSHNFTFLSVVNK